MKKALIILLSLCLIFAICACGGEEKEVTLGTVTQVESGYFLVEDEGGSLYSLSLDLAPQVQKGNRVRITHDGLIQETHPAQFHKIYSVEIL